MKDEVSASAKPKRIRRYEYLTCGAGISDEKLNDLGKDGWELVCSLPALGGILGYLFFKRPL